MAKKGVLGKGLNALLPSEESSQSDEEASSESSDVSRKLYRFEKRKSSTPRVAEVAVEQIRPNPYQPRQDFDDEALEELASSIEQFGLIQPITLRAVDSETFEIISGERRLRAARRASLTHVPAYIRTAGNEEMLEMALVENVQREDLNPIEVALGYERLIDECGLTHEEVAEKVGKNRSTVTNFLRLLRLPPRVQACLRDRSISPGHARMLVNVGDKQLQIKLLDKILRKGLSVRNVEKLVRKYKQKGESDRKSKKENSTDSEPSVTVTPPNRAQLQIKDSTKKLRSHLSTQVRIQHKDSGNGKIEISYYDPEDLERLMDLLLDT